MSFLSSFLHTHSLDFIFVFPPSPLLKYNLSSLHYLSKNLLNSLYQVGLDLFLWSYIRSSHKLWLGLLYRLLFLLQDFCHITRLQQVFFFPALFEFKFFPSLSSCQFFLSLNNCRTFIFHLRLGLLSSFFVAVSAIILISISYLF